MTEDLKAKTIAGIIWSALEKFGVKIISFISNILLARLLTPDDYGCVGMLMIFVLLSMTVVEGGFGSAIIQKKNSTKEDESTMFYWNIFLSFILYGLLFVLSPIIADFYGIPQLSHILRVQGLMLLVNAFGILPVTLLRKDLEFKKIALINTCSALISVVVALLLAFEGYGIWALVWQQTCLYLIITLLSWFYCGWRPLWQFSFASLKSMFGYGSFLLLSNLLNTLCDNLQGLIIGKKFSASIMGYYTQAKKLEEVPTTSIAQVVAQVTFPVFSKIQDDQEKLYTAVRKSLMAMNFINIPLMLLLLLIAEPMIILVFSDKWIPSVPYFQILCISGIVNCGQSVNYQVVVAVGQSKQIFIWNIIKRIIGILLLFIGLFFGVKGILWGMVLGMYVTYVVNVMIASKITNYTLLGQIKDMVPVLACAIISSGVALYFSSGITSLFLHMIFSILIYLMVYMLLSLVLSREIMNLLFSIILKK